METTIAKGTVKIIIDNASMIKLSTALIIPVFLLVILLIVTKKLR